MDSASERKLVASSRKGDRSAYAELVKAYSARVFAVSLGILGNSHDAEDIAQQTLLRGFTEIDKLQDSRQFGFWICRIAKNLSVDFVRSQNRGRGSLARRAGAVQKGPEEHTALEGALAKLPQEQRLAVMLYYFDGRSTRNIAEILEITEAAVHTRMSRARKQLRKLLAAAGGA